MRAFCTFGLAALALCAWCAGPLDGAQPDLKKGVYIYDGSSPMAVDRHSTPEVVDWNNDGKKDLVVGQFTYGKHLALPERGFGYKSGLQRRGQDQVRHLGHHHVLWLMHRFDSTCRGLEQRR